ncbi:MAG TPA: isochorismatase family cysteine hydrolase [Methanospirillum sp.]|uniref:cysteine hydrolase family protein n=1 Tax=Methanospirillum sp. TaxID=45200 RepID=UPI002C67F71F|nr:isochorismatase family cysteine hydrolase [Methanospirillum sp.]HWQ65065.1 isochorismatase family cysteine hydrolase [Methanospirillum sp.]
MSKPALLLIDMQNDFVLEGKPLQVKGACSIIPKIQNVLDQFRSAGLPVFHVVRIHRPDGSDVEIMRKELFQKTPFAVEGTPGAAVIHELAPLESEYLLPKIRMSAFIGTGLDLTLRTLGVDTIVVAGIQTPNCIRTTVFDAMAYNYHTFLVTDATAAQSDEIHQSNVRDMANIGVQIIRSTDIVSCLEW